MIVRSKRSIFILLCFYPVISFFLTLFFFSSSRLISIFMGILCIGSLIYIKKLGIDPRIEIKNQILHIDVPHMFRSGGFTSYSLHLNTYRIPLADIISITLKDKLEIHRKDQPDLSIDMQVFDKELVKAFFEKNTPSLIEKSL